MDLVVGATGHLGSLLVRRLREDGRPVRAMVRDRAAAADLAGLGAELVVADLHEPSTLDAAVDGVDGVLATANVVAPSRPGDTHAAVEVAGYRALAHRAARAGVRRVVLAGVPHFPLDDAVPQLRSKRAAEAALEDAGLSWTSLRMPPFTEVWLALVGSRLPFRGEHRSLDTRPYAFLQVFRRATGGLVEDRGVMLVPGSTATRHAFLSVHDAARAMVAALDVPDLQGAVDLGGPEVLSWADVGRAFEEVLGRRVRVVAVPPAVFAVGQRVLTPVAPSAANVLGLERALGAHDTAWDTAELAERLGLTPLRTVRDVLREKAGLAAVR